VKNGDIGAGIMAYAAAKINPIINTTSTHRFFPLTFSFSALSYAAPDDRQ
jgi:hypothetical protein